MAVTPTYGGETTNYKMAKPALTDAADIGIVNADMDIIDDELKTLSDTIEDVGNVISNFRQAAGYSKRIMYCDLNTLIESGMYYCIEPTHSPHDDIGATEKNCYIATIAYTTSLCSQLCIGYLDRRMFYRSLYNGSWSQWMEVSSDASKSKAIALTVNASTVSSAQAYNRAYRIGNVCFLDLSIISAAIPSKSWSYYVLSFDQTFAPSTDNYFTVMCSDGSSSGSNMDGVYGCVASDGKVYIASLRDDIPANKMIRGFVSWVAKA